MKLFLGKEMRKRTFFALGGLLFLIGIMLTDSFWLKFVPLLRLNSLNGGMIFLGGTGGIIILILLTLLATRRLFFFLPFLTTGVLSYGLKYIIQRPRPFLVTEIAPLLIKHSPSFPSTHAALAGVCIPFFRGKWRGGFIVLVLVVAFTGYYNGVHYLGDVFGGLFLGWSIGSLLLWKKEAITSWVKRMSKRTQK